MDCSLVVAATLLIYQWLLLILTFQWNPQQNPYLQPEVQDKSEHQQQELRRQHRAEPVESGSPVLMECCLFFLQDQMKLNTDRNTDHKLIEEMMLSLVQIYQQFLLNHRSNSLMEREWNKKDYRHRLPGSKRGVRVDQRRERQGMQQSGLKAQAQIGEDFCSYGSQLISTRTASLNNSKEKGRSRAGQQAGLFLFLSSKEKGLDEFEATGPSNLLKSQSVRKGINMVKRRGFE